MLGVFDPLKYTNADMCRIHGIVYETLMEDEENQIHGFVHFNDGQGVGFPHLTLFTPREAIRILKNSEVRFIMGSFTISTRHKIVLFRPVTREPSPITQLFVIIQHA